jgi:hypothetical protein
MKSESGRLIFQRGSGPLRFLPVTMNIPDTYRARFQVLSQPPRVGDGGRRETNDRKYEWIEVADLARSRLPNLQL